MASHDSVSLGTGRLSAFVVIAVFGLPSGSPGYSLELWVASAMLAVTFASYSAFGPLRKNAAEPASVC